MTVLKSTCLVCDAPSKIIIVTHRGVTGYFKSVCNTCLAKQIGADGSWLSWLLVFLARRNIKQHIRDMWRAEVDDEKCMVRIRRDNKIPLTKTRIRERAQQ